MYVDNKFFESIFNESRTTDAFNKWWFEYFTKGMFDNKRVLAKIDFFPINSLYDNFYDHFTTVLYDASKEKLSSSKAQEAALNKLRRELQEHFENKMNDYCEENLPENVVEVKDDSYSIDYGDKEFSGPHDSLSEFVIDVDKESPNSIKGTLLKTYKTKRIEPENLPWRIGMEGVGKVYSYSGVDNVISKDDSPYIDGVDIRLDQPGTYTEKVECVFNVKIITEEV